MLHVAYLLFGGGGALLGAWAGYAAGICLAYYGTRALAARVLAAQDDH